MSIILQKKSISVSKPNLKCMHSMNTVERILEIGHMSRRYAVNILPGPFQSVVNRTLGQPLVETFQTDGDISAKRHVRLPIHVIAVGVK